MMFFEEEIALCPPEARARPEPEVRECAEQRRFEAICARELRGDQD